MAIAIRIGIGIGIVKTNRESSVMFRSRHKYKMRDE